MKRCGSCKNRTSDGCTIHIRPGHQALPFWIYRDGKITDRTGRNCEAYEPIAELDAFNKAVAEATGRKGKP